MNPSLSTRDPYQVALVGEALGEDEASYGSPFVGKAGFKLTRLIQWAGLDRSRFDIWNVCWCRPPNNDLGDYENEAGAFCRNAHWDHLLNRVNVVVPMGNVALSAFTGRKGILATRGYIEPGPGHTHLLPTVHPSFIQRGQSRWSAPFILDIQRAVDLAVQGLHTESVDFLLDPSPWEALQWAREAVANPQVRRIAYDIETPGKKEDEDELELDDEEGDKTYYIYRIGFASRPGVAMSVPWEPPYLAAIRLLLECRKEKVVWHAGYDNPRIRARGVRIEGQIHDGMVAWHILHSDLPKSLRFVATFTCPFQARWKHLSKQQPAFYNATDADVELKSMEAIEADLKRTGLWDVYVRDVIELDPILEFMTAQGMPIDHEVRLARAVQLAEKQQEVLAQMESLVPLEARRIEHVYKAKPKDPAGLLTRQSRSNVRRCSTCGLERPRKDHFRRLVKKPNPCADARVVELEEDTVEFYRLAPFKPSRDQLIRYNTSLNRPIPTKFDKKTRTKKPTMDEKALRWLEKKYPLDTLYASVLEYRELDKVAGTYIGRPTEES